MLAESRSALAVHGADDFKGMQDDTNSRFGGLGVRRHRARWQSDHRLADGRFAGLQAGLLPGDQIIKIDGAAHGEDGSERRDRTSCAASPGQKVTLTILPRRDEGDQRFRARPRESSKCASVKDAKMLPRGAGGRLQDRLRADHAIQRADRRRTRAEARRTGEAGHAGASCSICATIPAGCSIPPSMSPGSFCRRRRSSFPPKAACRRRAEIYRDSEQR